MNLNIANEIRHEGWSFPLCFRQNGGTDMAICQLMVLDFMRSVGRFDEDGEERYSDANLEEGLAYVTDLIREGHKREPYHKYGLRAFRKWALERLKDKKPTEQSK